MKIELIYFEGCPNAEKARDNLRKAFNAAGIDQEWTEWEQSSLAAPEHIKKYGSPTILIDGVDVVSSPNAPTTANSCRIYEGGAPSVSSIMKALMK